MDEKNGAGVSQENPVPEEEVLKEDISSDDQASDSAQVDEPAADSNSLEEESAGGDTPLEEPSEDAPENVESDAPQQMDDIPEGEEAQDNSGLLSQADIDDALRQEAENGGDVDGMSKADIDAAINSATDGLDPDGFGIPTDDMVKEADFQQLSSSAKEGIPRNIDLLMDVDLPVSIELGRTRMNISDILSLGPGSVVELEKLVGEPVDLLVNNKCVARGEVVVVEENFGLRITHLISPEERIKNLQ